MPLLETEILWRLLLAAALGAVLGVERSISGKHAGLRTYALVSLGSCLFTALGLITGYQYSMFPSVNPLQLAGYVIVGVGFIGTGLAVFRGEHPVELTTAVGIWLAAGVGMAVGFGLYESAVGATVLGILIFSVFAKVEHGLRVRWGRNAE